MHTDVVRLFAGVWPDDQATRILAELPRPERDGVRWTTADQWHVTVAFLGELPVAAVEGVVAAIGAATRELAGRPVARLGPATALLGPSVLCVPVTGLDVAAAGVRRELATAGRAYSETRPFRGHVTLARGRGGRPLPQDLSGVEVTAEWAVDAIDLVRSELTSTGARYETLVRATIPTQMGGQERG